VIQGSAPDAPSLIAALERIDRRVEALPDRERSAFFAWAARGLLPAYRRFAARQRWGDVAALELALDAVDRLAAPDADPETIVELAPDADEFDDADTIGAQDAVIAVDASIRARLGLSTAGSSDHVLEHAEMKVTEQRTGSTGLGSGPEAEAWDRAIMAEPGMRAAVEVVERCLAALEANRPIDADGAALDPS
jgi:hypothetical protein